MSSGNFQVTFFEQWKSYRQRVLPVNAPSVQVIETKRGFYAGGAALLHLFFETVGDGPGPPEGAVQKLNRISQELREFGQAGGIDER